MAGIADARKKAQAKTASSPLAAKIAARKQQSNGAEPKGVLAALSKKKKGKLGGKGLAGLRKKHDEQRIRSSALDFNRNGVRFHGVRIEGEIVSPNKRFGRHWGYVTVSNGDKSFRIHNRFGSWMADAGQEGKLFEPARVAKELGVSIGQLEMGRLLNERWARELKDRGIKTPAQKQAEYEKAEADKRKRLADLEAKRKKAKEKRDAKKEKSSAN